MDVYNVAKHMRITRFLIEINKLMDGIYVEETTENHLGASIKFEAKLTHIYAHPHYWSPSEKFFQIVMNAAKKFFRGVHEIEDFTWNNTNTIFNIGKDKI